MSAEIERSPQARALAETALVRLLWELREQDQGLIVLGGLVPGVLTMAVEGVAPVHLGTTDVDMLLIAQLDDEIDRGEVERALTLTTWFTCSRTTTRVAPSRLRSVCSWEPSGTRWAH